MGSIIQATPMIEAIRKRFPTAEITFVSTNANREILKKIKTIDTVITIDDSSFYKLATSLIKTQFFLLKKRPEIYIDLEIYSNFSTLVTLFSLAKNRIGFHLRSSKYKLGIYTHMMFFNTKVPISDVYIQIAKLFGEIKETPSLYNLRLDKLDNHLGLEKNKYIVINPNASDLRIERRWEKEKFVQLIEKLLDYYPQSAIILIGNKHEKDYTNNIYSNFTSERVKSLAGKTTIDELISLISHASLMITNDTGPMHISFACQTPTICLFGPCSPEQYGWMKNTKVLYKKIYCSPCVHDFIIPPCNGDNQCMKLIEVDEVLDATTDFMTMK